MHSEFTKLLSQHIGCAFAKQLALADFLGGRNWGVDLSAGQATFGNDLTFPIQLLGTEADGDSTWLWAWANDQSDIPDELLVACNQLKELGNDQAIQEFTERSFPLGDANGHTIALIASGLHPGCGYFRGPYDGGALFFLVCDLPESVVGPVKPERVVRVLTEVIAQFEISHRITATSFLRSQGFELKPDRNPILATRGNDSLRISFDSLDRIENIEGTLTPVRNGKKRWWEFWK